MAKTIADVIGRLRGIKERLETPVEFFEKHRQQYREIAERVTLDTLLPVRPDGVEEDEWQARVHRISDAIVADLMEGAEAGLRIHLSAAEQEQLPEEISGPVPGIFGLETVREWVAAGKEGDEAGKQLDDRDVGRSEEQVARRVWWAMYTGRSANSGDRIRHFLTARQFEVMREYFPGLLQAWLDALVPKARADYRQFIREVVRGVQAPF